MSSYHATNGDKKMQKVKLHNICTLERGSSPRPIQNYITTAKDGVNWIKIGDTNPNEKYVNKTAEKITKEGAKKSRKVEIGDFILSNSMSLGHPFIMNINGYIHDGWFVLRPDYKKVDRDFLYYSLLSDYVQTQFKGTCTGSVVKNIRSELVNDIDIFLPDITEQKRIAKVLSNIDQKISVNREINRNLEELAKQIYDYWFVQFDFPNEEGKPYRSSDGKMVYNEVLKREIPDGWEVKSINDFCTSYRGVSYDKSNLLDSPADGVLVLRGNNIDGNTLVYDGNVAYIPLSFVEPEQKIKKHDIIMTMSSGSKEHVGKCTMFQNDSEHTYGAFMTKFTPNLECPFFAYRSMLSDFFKSKIKNICGGTGINNLTNQTFDEILFPFPAKNVLKSFEKVLISIYEKVGINNEEIFKLTKLRDNLLPLLMNGQVTLNSYLSDD
jgi:type I restriction enzyme S subunit